VPEDVAPVTVQVVVHLLGGGHEMIATGYAVKTEILTEARQFHDLLQFDKGQ